MQLFHQGLKDLLTLNQYLTNKKLEFLSIETTLPTWLKNFTQAIPIYAIGLNLRREYRHLAMGLRALKFKDYDAILVFEAYNQHLLFFLPLLALTRKEVLIMLHGNQQFAMNSKIKYLGLLYLKIYLKLIKKFKAILLEIDDDILPGKLQLPSQSKIVIPHPCRSDYLPSLKPGERLSGDTKIKIGIVGIIRADKPIAQLIEKIEEYQTKVNKNCELIIGTPKEQKPDYLNKANINLQDTTDEKDYIQVLRSIDILVIHYDRERYYYRTSGVISDAASCGCYMVASDYPLIKNQLTYPVEIGTTFKDFSELDRALDKAIDYVISNGQDNHWLWREKRTAKHIASLLFP